MEADRTADPTVLISAAEQVQELQMKLHGGEFDAYRPALCLLAALGKAVATAPAAPAPLPMDWKLAPTTPTVDMLEAVLKANPGTLSGYAMHFIRDYEAALAAAPKPSGAINNYPEFPDGSFDTSAQPSGAAPVASDAVELLDIGFKYKDGVHTPTVLVGFAPNDWHARDDFARTLSTSPAPAARGPLSDERISSELNAMHAEPNEIYRIARHFFELGAGSASTSPEPVMLNGLTAAETDATASVFGLSASTSEPATPAGATPDAVRMLTDEERSDLYCGSTIFRLPPYDKNPQSQRTADLMVRLSKDAKP